MYSNIFSFLWGGIYGWFEPIRAYYERRYDRIYKKLNPSLAWMPMIVIEMLAYNRIKSDSFIATDVSCEFYLSNFKTDSLISALRLTGVIPLQILRTNRGSLKDYAVIFKDQTDYHLIKLALDNNHKVLFYQGKELLKKTNKWIINE